MLNTLKDFDLLVTKTENNAYAWNISIHPTLINKAIALLYEGPKLEEIGVQLFDGMTLEG